MKYIILLILFILSACDQGPYTTTAKTSSGEVKLEWITISNYRMTRTPEGWLVVGGPYGSMTYVPDSGHNWLK